MQKNTNIFSEWNLTCLAFLTLFPFATATIAQQPSPSSATQYQAPTEWPGVYFQLTDIERLTPTRLVLMVWIQATAATPASGIFLGTPPEIPGGLPPPDKRKDDIQKYLAKPFLMTGATMKDEVSGTDYPVLPTYEPPGIACRPSQAIGPLLPGQMQVVSIQFAVPPPPPPPAPGQPAPKQTLSFLFPKAKEAIKHVPMPPPLPPTKTP